MKRYKLVDPSPEYQSCVEESLNGEWVKYEPWMDEAEKQYKTPTTIAAESKQKQPTICIKCKHFLELPFTSCECDVLDINFVTGAKNNSACYVKNNGNCPDFEARE